MQLEIYQWATVFPANVSHLLTVSRVRVTLFFAMCFHRICPHSFGQAEDLERF